MTPIAVIMCIWGAHRIGSAAARHYGPRLWARWR
jgi:hypothetical protein